MFTNTGTTETGTEPTETAARPTGRRFAMSKKALPWTIAGIMTVGLFGTLSTNGATGAVAASEPAQTVTQTLPAQTVTQTLPAQTTTTVPDACTLALTHAEDLLGLVRQALSISSEMIGAASRFDTAKLNSGTARIEALTPQSREMRAAYDAAATQCRGAAA